MLTQPEYSMWKRELPIIERDSQQFFKDIVEPENNIDKCKKKT